MPLFIAALLGGLIQIAGSLVGRVLLGLGMSYVTFKGVSAGLGWILDSIKDKISSGPAEIVQMAGVLQVDVSISIIFSALSARLLLNGLTPEGTITRLVTKK